ATVAATLASTLSADFTTRRWTSGTNYELSISHMPDLDQRRTGLDADSEGVPGAMYCVPTATANLFAYAAQHGYPWLQPGDHDFTRSGNYSRGTDFIDLLGAMMGTDGEDGTSNRNAYGTALMLTMFWAPTRFVVEYEGRTSSNVVSLRDLAKAGINQQAIQQFCYGRYEILGTNPCGETVIERTGGHCLTLVGAERSGESRRISFRNPWGDSVTTSQSAYATTNQEAPWVSNLLVASSTSGCPGSPQGMNAVETSRDDGLLRLIDSRVAIRPASFYSWGSYSGFLPEVGITTVGGIWGGDGLAAHEARTVSVNEGPGHMRSIVLSPSGTPFLLVAGPEGGLFVEEADENGAALVPVDLSALALPPIDEAVFAGDRTLVVRSGRMLFAISGLDAGMPEADDEAPAIAWTAEVPFQAAKLVASRGGQSPEGAWKPHSVYAFSADLRAMYEVSGDPESAPKFRNIPLELQLDPDPPDVAGTTIVEDSMGTLWFAQPGAAGVAGLLADGQTLFQPLPVESLDGFSIDDRDNLLVVDGGIVRCFSHGPNGLVETGLQGSIFAGQPAGKGFVVARSSSNFDPAFHSGPGWRNVVDEAPAPCVGDIDGDGVVGGSDLAAILGAWGSGNAPAADLDGDGLVTGADLSIVLGAWGNCE
ncbi:MAG: hypothetical protein RIS86_295, partial [Planctomycetota bacterium]